MIVLIILALIMSFGLLMAMAQNDLEVLKGCFFISVLIGLGYVLSV